MLNFAIQNDKKQAKSMSVGMISGLDKSFKT